MCFRLHKTLISTTAVSLKSSALSTCLFGYRMLDVFGKHKKQCLDVAAPAAPGDTSKAAANGNTNPINVGPACMNSVSSSSSSSSSNGGGGGNSSGNDNDSIKPITTNNPNGNHNESNSNKDIDHDNTTTTNGSGNNNNNNNNNNKNNNNNNNNNDNNNDNDNNNSTNGSINNVAAATFEPFDFLREKFGINSAAFAAPPAAVKAPSSSVPSKGEGCVPYEAPEAVKKARQVWRLA